MVIKTLDSKGRLSFGSKFANRLVLVDDSDDTRIVVVPAEAVPAHEAWLYKNRQALELVQAGIEQAAAGDFSKNPPDVNAKWIDELKEADAVSNPVGKTRPRKVRRVKPKR